MQLKSNDLFKSECKTPCFSVSMVAGAAGGPGHYVPEPVPIALGDLERCVGEPCECFKWM